MQTTKAQTSLSDHRLCKYSLSIILICYLKIFNILASLCSWAGLFERRLITNPNDSFSCVEAQQALNFQHWQSTVYATSLGHGTRSIISFPSFLWDIVNQCRPRASDHLPTLFVYKCYIKIWITMKYTTNNPKHGNWWGRNIPFGLFWLDIFSNKTSQLYRLPKILKSWM